MKVTVLWILDENKNILLAQRAHHKKQEPGKWGPSVTGKLEAGENFRAALLRECQEELSIEPQAYTPQYLLEREFQHPDGESRQFGVFYAILPRSKESLIHVDEQEVAGVAWVSYEDVVHKLDSEFDTLVPSARVMWPDTFALLKKAGVL